MRQLRANVGDRTHRARAVWIPRRAWDCAPASHLDAQPGLQAAEPQQRGAAAGCHKLEPGSLLLGRQAAQDLHRSLPVRA